ncbi:esterase-like activity of phytase family protein [Pacificibacter sp. AS14]|uniref:esterase-like activity of phytase family protein n=1 Tax=Pacificibacter sp. AS14 TaxID=3135785 RepID=UPI003178A096
MLSSSLLALSLIVCFAQSLAAETQYIGSYLWTSNDPLHGGYSGLEVTDDGASFTAISDHGSIVLGRFSRNEMNVIDNITTSNLHKLKGAKSDTLLRKLQDAEGLAIADDGEIFVSFEGSHRLWKYASNASRATELPQHPAFKALQPNSSLEALAITESGDLLTVPERSGGETVPFPIYRFDGQEWGIPYTIPRRGNYLPVGMDIGPDGKLYLLERWFRGIGFSSRVRRFDMGDQTLTGEVTLLESPLGAHDNLEGIAVWYDGTGIRLTMVSDDNFKAFQVTEFVEYRVTD